MRVNISEKATSELEKIITNKQSTEDKRVRIYIAGIG